MNKPILLALAANLVLSAPAYAALTVNYGSATAIDGTDIGHDFKPQLSALGLTQLASTGASLLLDSSTVITFEVMGSVSGFDETFSATSSPNLSYSEHSLYQDNFNSPIPIGSGAFSAGDLRGKLNFTGYVPATVGDENFGIFLKDGEISGSNISTFYIGYDDNFQDFDYNDLIIRGTIASAPEPATWAMMLVGFGFLGVAMRGNRARKARGCVHPI